ncbi:MAG TPA: Rid family detoxifying hydrolase [Casimicrobiaceae bacterium]|nr:Rid family detoxifying hydrolase [Casimicrobiaceae bacterium]
MTIGGRPLVWKQGPGDPPQTQKEAVPLAGSAGGGGSASSAASSQSQAQGQPRVLSGSVGERNNAGMTSVPQSAGTTTVAQAAAPAAGSTLVAPGPSGYTQATRYGDLLFLSGIIALDRSGGLAGGKIEEQTQQVMENVRAVLENNRLTMANVVSVTVYLSNINDINAMDRVYNSYFRSHIPARSVVEVARLPRGALVEMSVVAGR